MHSNPRGSGKTQIPGPNSVGLGLGLGMCTSVEFPGDTVVAGPGPHFEHYGVPRLCFSGLASRGTLETAEAVKSESLGSRSPDYISALWVIPVYVQALIAISKANGKVQVETGTWKDLDLWCINQNST